MRFSLLLCTGLLAALVPAGSASNNTRHYYPGHHHCHKPPFAAWELKVNLPGQNATHKDPLCLQIGSTVHFTWQVQNVTSPDPKNGTGGHGVRSFRTWLGTATDQWSTKRPNSRHYETRPVSKPYCASNGTLQHGNFTVKSEGEPVYPNATIPITFWATNADVAWNSSWTKDHVIAATFHKATPVYLAQDCKVFKSDLRRGKIHLEHGGKGKNNGTSSAPSNAGTRQGAQVRRN